MKLLRLTQLLTFGLLLAVAATGCKSSKPKTLFQGSQTPGGTENPNVGPGEKLPGSTEGTGGGIPSNPPGSHAGWIENASTFQADTVHFGYDSSVVRTEDKSKIAAVADYLKSNSSDAVRVEGHCDERGTEEYNRALGERRALAIREVLAGLGIEPSRVDTVSYGKDRPVAPGHDEPAWKKNRRGVFIQLSPPNKP
jgi:peptidoglycan-associated lipoprotein